MGYEGRYKRPLTSRDLIGNEKEKRYKRNIMFLFAGHSDKPLKSLISIAHKENNICLYRFSFIYAVDDLWEVTYICPIYAVACTTESANLRYRTHGYGMSAYWVTAEINLYSHHNLSSTSLDEF